MNQELIHVYFMPGMAADPAIFEYIELDKGQFKVHLLQWCIPLEGEDLRSYAKRMSADIVEKDPVLVGVSFGGVLIQEMSLFLKPRKVIIISSVKSRLEMPRRMRLAKQTHFYKLLPTQLAQNIEIVAKFSLGKTIKKRMDLYQRYLSVRDTRYLNWAIRNMVHWDRQIPVDGVIHIHGEKDLVFPIRYISDCIMVKNGTHIMIISKYRWFNENLPKLILS